MARPMRPRRHSFERAMDTHDHVLCSQPTNDLKRNIYCVLGLPIDALDMLTILRQIDVAATDRTLFLSQLPI